MKHTSIVLLLCCGFSVAAHAQPQRFAFEHITAKDGLPDNLVWDVFQDHLGFVWFSAGTGLVKYDGYDMTVYDLQVTVTRFFEDTAGRMWLASLGGLIQFDRDAEVFRSFPHVPDDSTTIGGRRVISIREDGQGYLWLITGPIDFENLHPEITYLDRFDPQTETVRRFRHDPNEPTSFGAGRIPDNRTGRSDMFRFAIHADSKGRIWVGTDVDGLHRYEPDAQGFVHYRHDERQSHSVSSNNVTAISEDPAGILWVGTAEAGLNQLDVESGRFTRFRHRESDPSSLCDDQILRLHPDRHGSLWITTRTGLCRYDASSATFHRYDHDPANPHTPGPGPVFVAVEEKNGSNMWLMSDYSRQLDYYVRSEDRFIRYEQDLRDEGGLRRFAGIFSVILDRAGILWVGTWEGGVNKIGRSSEKFGVFRHSPIDPHTLSDDFVTGIHEDANGAIWIGTGFGLNRIMPGNDRAHRVASRTGDLVRFVHNPRDASSLSHNSVSDIVEGLDGALWVGTEGGGLNRLDPTTGAFTRFLHDRSDPASLSHNNVTSLVRDASGELWVGTRGGLNRYDSARGTFTHYRMIEGDEHSLCSDEVHKVYVDRAGTLWVGGNLGGLCRFDPEDETFSRYFLTNDVETIIAVFEDSAGRFWVGTHGLGLFLLDRSDRSRKRYSESDGLPQNKVKSIEEDARGQLWIGTERGLARFDPVSETFRAYDLDDGLPSQFFTWPEAVSVTASGEMLFGTDRGLIVFDPEYVKRADNVEPPNVVLTGLRIFNEPVRLGDDSPLKKHINTADKITLRHAQNDVSIDYAGLHFARPEKNRYAHKLDGYDASWRQVGAQRTATYTSLDPGEYVFRVKASNSDGIWNEEGASLRITVLPPFWLTWWFRSSMALTILLAGFTAYWKRVSTLEQKRLELEQRVKERTEAAEALEHALSEVERLKNRLEAENTYLQQEITLQHNFENIVTQSDALKQVLHSVEQVAATEATVLILGETGTGKELLARAIHSISPRGDRPLVKVNCAALPAELIESELFGHEKGAFTGATARKIGRFELADGGTIFLDEIGDLPLELQAKLLRVLQEGEFERLGGTATIKVDVRVIAATNRDLEKEKADGTFREDLFYRLNVFPIESPPLRERKEDIPLLVNHFVERYTRKTGKRIDAVPTSVITCLQAYDWPGNVRELENVIERAVILSPGQKLVLGDTLPRPTGPTASGMHSLEEMERRHILKALEMCGGRVFGENGAAKILDINPQTLTSRMKRLGIKRKRQKL